MATRRAYKWSEQFQKGREVEELLTRVYSEREGYLVVHGTGHHDRKQGVDGILIKKLDVNEIFKVDWKLDQKIEKTGNITIEAVSVRLGGSVETIIGHRKAVGGRVVKEGWATTSQADRVVFYSPWERRAYEVSLPAIRQYWSLIQRHSLDAVETAEDGRRWVTENYYVPVDWLELHGILLRVVDTRPRWTLKFAIPPGARLVWARIRGETP